MGEGSWRRLISLPIDSSSSRLMVGCRSNMKFELRRPAPRPIARTTAINVKPR